MNFFHHKEEIKVWSNRYAYPNLNRLYVYMQQNTSQSIVDG